MVRTLPTTLDEKEFFLRHFVSCFETLKILSRLIAFHHKTEIIHTTTVTKQQHKQPILNMFKKTILAALLTFLVCVLTSADMSTEYEGRLTTETPYGQLERNVRGLKKTKKPKGPKKAKGPKGPKKAKSTKQPKRMLRDVRRLKKTKKPKGPKKTKGPKEPKKTKQPTSSTKAPKKTKKPKKTKNPKRILTNMLSFFME